MKFCMLWLLAALATLNQAQAILFDLYCEIITGLGLLATELILACGL